MDASARRQLISEQTLTDSKVLKEAVGAPCGERPEESFSMWGGVLDIRVPFFGGTFEAVKENKTEKALKFSGQC